MTDAYAYASEGHYSPEIERLARIDRFGIEAVTGKKVFMFGDFIRLRAAENIVNAYMSRKQSGNWAEWVASNPRPAQLLADIEMQLED
jgi:hypothetical protein